MDNSRFYKREAMLDCEILESEQLGVTLELMSLINRKRE